MTMVGAVLIYILIVITAVALVLAIVFNDG